MCVVLSFSEDYPGTVLVFLPGEAEILNVKKALQTEEGSEVDHVQWDILVLHSRIPMEDTQYGKHKTSPFVLAIMP